MEKKERNLYFFDWFSRYSKENDLKYPFGLENKINSLEKKTTPWKTLEDKIIESKYPLQEGLKLQLSKDLEIEAVPYKKA